MHAASPQRKQAGRRSRAGLRWDPRGRGGIGLVVSLLILTGCPRRFDSRADPIPGTTDPTIEREYRDARARLDAGDAADAAARYATFAEHHPDDPLARSAKIGEARARLELGQPDKAKEVLEPIAKAGDTGDPLADPIVARARFLLGAALIRSGELARGRELLARFRDLPATRDDETELHALFATAALGLADFPEALLELERFLAGARPAERRYILATAPVVAGSLAAGDLDRLWRGPRDALLTAFVGPRYAEARRQAGDLTSGARADEEVIAARTRLGLDVKHAAPQPRQLKSALGCVFPLSGKSRALGERALRGALLGAELLGAAGGQGLLTLEVRDSGSDAARTRAAVEELAQSGVLAIIGAPDRVGATEVAAAANTAGVPLFALGADDGRGGALLFRLARARADAARAAARLMADEHLERVAILGPDGASGRELARVFAEAARARGLQVLAEVRYAEAATSFVHEVQKIAAAHPQAIFLPATAAQLDLLAPQLASSGLTAMANLKATGHEARLFVTADGLSPKNLVRSGKYLQGATLMPPFWADPVDPRALAFLERYHEAYAEDPSVLDALAFDAVRAVRLLVSQHGEPQTWSEVGAALRELDAGGLTGQLGFGADGARTGEPAAWIVEGAALRPRGK